MRRLFIIAFIMSATLVQAHAEKPHAGQWPSDVAPPTTLTAIDKHAEVSGGFPSDDRRIVAIEYSSSSGTPMLCSGLWISTSFILTAAHCTCEGQKYLVSNDQKVISDDRKPIGKWVDASLVSRFSTKICGGALPNGDDLALLKLEENLFVQPGKVAKGVYSLLDDLVLLGKMEQPWSPITLSGYGFDGTSSASSGLRREAIATINTPFCTEALSVRLGCSPLKEFMAGGGEARIDTCASDSGAPAFRRAGTRFLPVGIVSRGLPIGQPYGPPAYCGAGGIYTTLGRNSVIDWLKKSVPSGYQAQH